MSGDCMDEFVGGLVVIVGGAVDGIVVVDNHKISTS